MKLHDYINLLHPQPMRTSRDGIITHISIETGICRTQMSNLYNDGYTNDKKKIRPRKHTMDKIKAWSKDKVDYPDWPIQ